MKNIFILIAFCFAISGCVFNLSEEAAKVVVHQEEIIKNQERSISELRMALDKCNKNHNGSPLIK